MKTLRHLFVFLISFTLLTGVANAQIDLNKVKDKATKTAKDKSKDLKNDNKETETETTIETESTTTTKTETKSTTSVTKDQEYIDYISEKYDIVYQNDDAMNIYDIERNGLNSDDHLIGAQKLDYINVLKKIEEKGTSGGVSQSEVSTLLNYGDKYTGIFNNYIKGWINNSIESAYKNRSEDLETAGLAAKNAYSLAQAAMLVIPDNEDLKTLYEDAKSTYDAIFPDYEKMIYTSDFHKENVGKILFSKTPIKIGAEDPAQFVTEFTAKDKIYAVAYLGGTIKGLGGWSYSKCQYTVDIDGTSQNISFTHNEEDYQLSYYLIEIIPAPDVAIHGLDPVEFANILAPLSPRNHTMELKFGSSTTPDMAIGEVKLDWADVDSEAIKANGDLASANAQENWAKNVQLPDYFSTPSSKFNDAQITEAKIKQLFKAFSSDCTEVLDIWIGDIESGTEWYVFDDAYGIPEFQRTTRYITIVYKASDGNCYFTGHNMALAKDYLGGGKYGEMYMSTVKFFKTRIACENVK